MSVPVWTSARGWVDGDTMTQARAQAYLADNFESGPSALTVSALTALFLNGPGAGARGYIRIPAAAGSYNTNSPLLGYELIPVYSVNIGAGLYMWQSEPRVASLAPHSRSPTAGPRSPTRC